MNHLGGTLRPIVIALLAVPLVVVMSAARPMPQSASGHVVTIKMVDNGSTMNKFDPKDVRVQRGDTLRFEQTGASQRTASVLDDLALWCRGRDRADDCRDAGVARVGALHVRRQPSFACVPAIGP